VTPRLRVVDARIDYGGDTLLRDVSFTVDPGQIIALLGPSGSGKSSLLRCICGVQRLDAGRILWDHTEITEVPAHRRDIGLVFQDPLLFPHLDVGANIAFGMRRHGLSKLEIHGRVDELLAMIGLTGWSDRPVTTLSGGEAQRVALARALAPRPRLLLLDEPFAALDRNLRERLVTDVRDVLHDLGIPAIHVTHAEEEAARIADAILVVAESKVREQST
jgi:ABC-type spermidine/putrescine transport systems, ATPase components